MPIQPAFKTDPREYSEEERVKIATRGLREDTLNIKQSIYDLSRDDLEKEVALISKSFGIYMEFHRDKARATQVKDWIYMIRVPIPGGGPISPEQWRIIDDIANRYTISDAYTGYPTPSIKITTRQAIQFHHVKKKDLASAIREIAESGLLTLNGCGDNVRNTVGCPISGYYGVFNSNEIARRVSEYFRLPTELYVQVFEIALTEDNPIRDRFDYPENLLPRKFKIGIAGVIRGEDGKYYADDCINVRTNDIGVVPLVSENGGVEKFQIYVGGSMGENNSYPTFSALALPIGTVSEGELIKTLDAIVRIQAEWGDRKDRHWARLKYLLYFQGIKWLREKVREYSGVELGPVKPVRLVKDLHLGWKKLRGKWFLGVFVENGRLIDGRNCRLKSMIRFISDNFDNVKLFTTANQHIIVGEIEEGQKEEIEKVTEEFNYRLESYSSLRLHSTACVGFPTCKLSFTDSERYLPKLIDELERRGFGNSSVSIGLSGCVAQCSRPALHPIAWIGSGYGLFMLKIGRDENSPGEPLIDYDEGLIYLYQVPASRVADVTEALIELYEKNKDISSDPSEVFRRLGNKKVIEWLRNHEKTKDLMKPQRFDRKIEGYKTFHELLAKRLEEVRDIHE